MSIAVRERYTGHQNKYVLSMACLLLILGCISQCAACSVQGLLDLLANRCLSNGTNAWTAEDHTCYTLSCAGAEGFLNILPIYLDHVLWPTLTDSGFYTEVHHINPEGENAGVVYCEMKARENTSMSIAVRYVCGVPSQMLYSEVF